MLIMPIMGGVGSLTLAMSNRASNPLIAIGAMAALVGSIGIGVVMILSQRMGRNRLLRRSRERYLDYVEGLRHALRDTIGSQRERAAWCHPPPEMLSDVARNDARRWERRRSDDDQLCLRIGVGDQPIAATLILEADTGPLNEFDPVCLGEAMALRGRYSILRDQPVTIDLRQLGVVSVLGDRYVGRQLATALATQLVTFHSPTDVRLAVVRADTQAENWDWVKWLPHCQSATLMDGDLPARLVASSVSEMSSLLAPELERRLDERSRSRGQAHDLRDHLVVVVDGDGLGDVRGIESPDSSVGLAELGVHLIILLADRREEPEVVDDRIEVRQDFLAVQRSHPSPFAVDQLPPGFARLVARILAPMRISLEERSGDESLEATVGLHEILGVLDPATLDPRVTWRKRQPRELLRVPIGIGVGGVVQLDLKESAHGGMGPHGMVVGATGSGKSEMLRTLVSSLVVSHGPDRLALMLVDFKGGATFAAMDQIPHLAGMITNLQNDLTLVDRMHDALFGEMQRRQELLKQVGNLPNVTAYQDLVDAGHQLEPLPHLLVIVDEFSELLTARPDFAELFVAIGRVGRSIGIHLLLATQKLEMGKIRGLESHLSYRISLRTFSESESRDAIGVPDAYHLPSEPGSGYLKVDTTVFARFRAALVSSTYRPPAERLNAEVPVVPYLAANGLGAWIAQLNAEAAATATAADESRGGSMQSKQSVLDVICQRLVASGAPPVRPVWLQPLPGVLPLDAVMDVDKPGEPAGLEATLGLVDDPSRQRQFPLTWDFTGGAGNLVVAGGPQSGKSTLVGTLIGSLALRYPPGHVAFYCVDYGGGTLRPLEDLPHVAAVATRLDPERVTRTISDVVTLLEGREEFFREHKLDSMRAMRQARVDGRIPLDVPSDVFLIVDGWSSFCEDFDAMEFTIGEVAARGLNYGVHVILTVAQNMQIRMRIQSSFGGRLELRLTDSFDSTIGRKLMDKLPREAAGRGLVDIGGGLVFQGAVPYVDGSTDDDVSAGQHGLVALAKSRWSTAVKRVQTLPAQVTVADLPEVNPGDDLLPLGLSQRNLGPAAVNVFGADPHLLVYGDGETGKTNTLKLLIRQLTASRTVHELAFIVVDYRRSLLDVVPPDYLAAYCTGEEKTADTIAQVTGALRERLPGEDVTSAQLRTRGWWKGVDIVVVVDDYDLVSTPSSNPVHGLLEFLPQGRDLGLHLVIARRTGGLSRALFEPVLQRLSDLQTPGVVLSGDRTEGRLVNGVVARRLPPGRAIYAARADGTDQVQVALLNQ